MKNGREKIRIVLRELFFSSLLSLVLFSLLEIVWSGSVLSYFNLVYLLLFSLIIAILNISLVNNLKE